MHCRRFRVSFLSPALLICVLASRPSIGSALDDYFGDGDGHHGAKSVTTTEVINEYSRVAVDVAVNDTSITVVDGTKFVAGDLVLLWQVDGYSTPASGDQSEIDLTGQPVGRFELARVDFVLGNDLVLRRLGESRLYRGQHATSVCTGVHRRDRRCRWRHPSRRLGSDHR